MNDNDVNDWIRRSAGIRPAEPPVLPFNPTTAASIRANLTAAGEPIPTELQPPKPTDYGGGPRGVPTRQAGGDMTEWIRETVRRKRGESNA